MRKIKELIVSWMADVFPANCPLQRTFFGFTFTPCKLNFFYKDVMALKLKRLGYDPEELE